MSNDERRQAGASEGDNFSGGETEQLWTVIWSRRWDILLGLLAGTLAYAAAVSVALFLMPWRQVAALEFRLVFEEATDGHLPGGARFNPRDIISSTVLSEVYMANDLERYWRFQDFDNGVSLLPSNPRLDAVLADYRARLAEPRLTPADRAKIEEEYREKWTEGLREPRYELRVVREGRLLRVPPSLLSKVLNDTLAVWARRAHERQGALRFEGSAFTPQLLRRELQASPDLFIRSDQVRIHIARVLDNVERLSRVPGAAIVRSPVSGGSLAAIQANLEDVLRLEVQPLLSLLQQESPVALVYLDTRVRQMERQTAELEANREALQRNMREYVLRGQGFTVGAGPDPAAAAPGSRAPAPRGGVVRPSGDSFLDRLLYLATRDEDVRYRQSLVEQIVEQNEVLSKVRAERSFYERLARGTGPSAPSPVALGGENAEASIVRAVKVLERAMEDVDAISGLIFNRYFNAPTLLYRSTRPVRISVRPPLGPRFIVLVGAFVLSSLFVALCTGVIVAHRRRSRVGPPVSPVVAVTSTQPLVGAATVSDKTSRS